MTPWIWIPLDNKMNSRNIFQLLPYSAVWTFQDFSVTQILHESILEDLKVEKLLIFEILRALNFVLLVNFSLEDTKNDKKKNIEPLNVSKWRILPFFNPQN